MAWIKAVTVETERMSRCERYLGGWQQGERKKKNSEQGRLYKLQGPVQSEKASTLVYKLLRISRRWQSMKRSSVSPVTLAPRMKQPLLTMAGALSRTPRVPTMWQAPWQAFHSSWKQPQSIRTKAQMKEKQSRALCRTTWECFHSMYEIVLVRPGSWGTICIEILRRFNSWNHIITPFQFSM